MKMKIKYLQKESVQARILHLLQAVTTVWVFVLLRGYCLAALVYTYIDNTAAMDLIIYTKKFESTCCSSAIPTSCYIYNMMIAYMLIITTVDASLVGSRPFV